MSTKTVTVEDEYRKNPELKKEDVNELLEWAKTQPHLPKISGIFCMCFILKNLDFIQIF